MVSVNKISKKKRQKFPGHWIVLKWNWILDFGFGFKTGLD